MERSCKRLHSVQGELSQVLIGVGALPHLQVDGSMVVDVRVGAASPVVVVEADANLLPLIHTEARGDTLRICRAQMAGQERPREFVTQDNPGVFIVTWKRQRGQ